MVCDTIMSNAGSINGSGGGYRAPVLKFRKSINEDIPKLRLQKRSD